MVSKETIVFLRNFFEYKNGIPSHLVKSHSSSSNLGTSRKQKTFSKYDPIESVWCWKKIQFSRFRHHFEESIGYNSCLQLPTVFNVIISSLTIPEAPEMKKIFINFFWFLF